MPKFSAIRIFLFTLIYSFIFSFYYSMSFQSSHAALSPQNLSSIHPSQIIRFAIDLFIQVNSTLEFELDQENAPKEYRSAYNKFRNNRNIILSEINEHPEDVVHILTKHIANLGMSHLYFAQLQEGGFGIETVSADNNTEKVVKVYPGSPAELEGIHPGDILTSINNQPASQILRQNSIQGEKTPSLLEGLPYQILLKSESNGVIADKNITLTALPQYLFNTDSIKHLRTNFREIDHGNGKKIVHLKIMDFYQHYDPEIVHQAFEQAKKDGLLVIDLRGNLGGRSEHLLKYIIQSQKPILTEIGSRIITKDAFLDPEQLDLYLLHKAISNEFSLHWPAQILREITPPIELKRSESNLNSPIAVNQNHIKIKLEPIFNAFDKIKTWGEILKSAGLRQDFINLLDKRKTELNTFLIDKIIKNYDDFIKRKDINLLLQRRNELINNVLIRKSLLEQNQSAQNKVRLQLLQLNEDLNLFTSKKQKHENKESSSNLCSLSSTRNAESDLTKITNFNIKLQAIQEDEILSEKLYQIQTCIAHCKAKLERFHLNYEKLKFKMMDIDKQILALETEFQEQWHSLREKHFQLLDEFNRETKKKLNQLFNPGHEPNSVKYFLPNEVNQGFAWSSRIKSKPFPYTGKLVFLVDQDTSCAAEVCPLVTLEYQALRNTYYQPLSFSTEDPNSSNPLPRLSFDDSNSLFPESVHVIGQTQGRAQIANKTFIPSPLGSFMLYHPRGDIYTVGNQRIEGNGLKGEPIKSNPISLDPALSQAIMHLYE